MEATTAMGAAATSSTMAAAAAATPRGLSERRPPEHEREHQS